MPRLEDPKHLSGELALQRRGLFPSQSREKHAFRCFIGVVVSIYLNFFLAILNAHGVAMDTGKVSIAQIAVTFVCGFFILLGRPKVRDVPLLILVLLFIDLVVMNLIKVPNLRSFYDCMVIPLYIALGASAGRVRSKWMLMLFGSVYGLVLLEWIEPNGYIALAQPSDYFMATREWIANQAMNKSSAAGYYAGAFRGGSGSVFLLNDHRLSGPFLEPLSLGYFSTLMAIYFCGIYESDFFKKIALMLACILLSLLSDSRAATAIIIVCSIILLAKARLPALIVWMAAPLVMLVAWGLYVVKPDFIFGDTFGRIALTFDAISDLNIYQFVTGDISLDRVGDSGFIYLIYCFGPFALFIAIWYYCGLFTRRTNLRPKIFVAFSLYVSTALLFGGAVLSIKTASMLGFLVGLAGWPPHAVGVRRVQ